MFPFYCFSPVPILIVCVLCGIISVYFLRSNIVGSSAVVTVLFPVLITKKKTEL